MAGLSIVALLFFSYVAGAAALFLDLPSAEFMRRAFAGALAWNEREFPSTDPGISQDLLTHVTVTADEPRQTCDGFTLVTTTEASRATLLEMKGNIVHRWELPFSRAWPRAPHIRRPIPDHRIHWFRSYLYPNGDLLAVYHANGDTPYGYGLAKMDPDSNLLWTFSANVHHDVDVGEDGTILTLTQKYVDPPAGAPKSVAKRHLADYLVVLSPEGKKLKEIPILEAFRDSPFALLLSVIDKPVVKGAPPSVIGPESPREAAGGYGATAKGGPPNVTGPVPSAIGDLDVMAALSPMPHDPRHGDVLHVNSVKFLRQSQAARFPLFKPGEVLISVRNIDVLAVLNVETGRVVWAARGPWRRQHDADFLDNGNLLVYDNLGSLAHSRVLEYNPQTQAVGWSYTDENSKPIQALLRGAVGRLANGNTLIVDPDEQRILEVTPEKRRVWECCCPVHAQEGDANPFHGAITGARRYPADLPFLKGESRARP
jgi:hypothetical protein